MMKMKAYYRNRRPETYMIEPEDEQYFRDMLIGAGAMIVTAWVVA